MRKNIKFSERSILLLYYSFCMSLRAPLWVRGNLIFLYIFHLLHLYISSHTYSSHYNYTLFPYANFHFPTNEYFINALFMSFRHTLYRFCSHLSFPPLFMSFPFPFVIPAKAGIHLFLSLRAQIYQGAAISLSLYFNILPFLDEKYYKKTIIFINIYYILLFNNYSHKTL